MNIAPKQLLYQLVQDNIVDQQTADKFELASIQKNIPIYDYLLYSTTVNKGDILKATAEVLGIPYVDLTTSPADPQATGLVSESIARRYNILPYRYDPATQLVSIATADPFSTSVSEFIEKKIAKKVVLVLAIGG